MVLFLVLIYSRILKISITLPGHKNWVSGKIVQMVPVNLCQEFQIHSIIIISKSKKKLDWFCQFPQSHLFKDKETFNHTNWIMHWIMQAAKLTYFALPNICWLYFARCRSKIDIWNLSVITILKITASLVFSPFLHLVMFVKSESNL